MFELKDKEFQYIVKSIYDYAKINLTEKKRSLVISRLSKRIRTLGLTGFSEYIDYLKHQDHDHLEFQNMVDAISTNFSSFFREAHHLFYLEEQILPQVRGPVKIWSAASSTGQEIYSILISIKEYERKNSKSINCNLFASDISREVLMKASKGIYLKKEVERLEKNLLGRYFLEGKNNHAAMVKLKPEYIRKVTFFRMNLTDSQYHIPQMDIIFLRNAIIYFDRTTKIDLMKRLYHYLKPGGYLFLGHSESLTGISEDFEVVGKTIYRRPLTAGGG